jgi:hypothetical protein
MRQSLKTRLLSAAYRAACALADTVFNFTERLRAQKDDSYLDDLYAYRYALAEERNAGNALLGALRRHLDDVQAELDTTDRELNGRFPPPYAVADFDDLPAPQGVDENEAPDGYKAAVSTSACTECAFDPVGTCPNNDGGPVRCNAEFRGDGQEVMFQRR